MKGSAPKRPIQLVGYTENQRTQLLQLMTGGVTQTAGARMLGIEPSVIAKWVARDKDFAAQWKVAKIAQAHAWGDEMMEIADAAPISMEGVAHAKLRCETRKWLMSCVAPQHYGAKVQKEHTHHMGVVFLPPLNTSQKAIKSLAEYVPTVESETVSEEVPNDE